MKPLIPKIDIASGGTPFEDPEKAAAIKAWTAELLKLPESAVVLVAESRCADPSCPLVETVLGVFEDGRTRKWSFARPRYAVSKALVQLVLEANPDGMG